MPAWDFRFKEPPAPRNQMILYSQCLDEIVPEDAPVRELAAILEEVDWFPWENHYKGYGQPPIHPSYMAGAILLGLMQGVRSSRQLENAACKNIDFIWLLEGFAPDHSTFCNFRNDHEKAIKDLHKQIARAALEFRCSAVLELLLDGTRIRANSAKDGMRTAAALERMIAGFDQRIQEMKRNDAGEALPETEYFGGMEPARSEEELAALDAEIAKLEKKREKCKKALDTVRERDEKNRNHNGKNAKAVQVPVNDPSSQNTPNKEGGCAPNYTPVIGTETELGIIVHGDVLDGCDESSAVEPAAESVEELAGQKLDAMAADGNFASGAALDALDRKEIDAYMPTRSASPPDNPALRDDPTQPVAEEDMDRLPRRGKQFDRSAFIHDAEKDVYYCPAGEVLEAGKPSKTKDGTPCTYYKCTACSGCPLAGKCLGPPKGKNRSGPRYRSISRDIYESQREAANQRMATEEGKGIYRKRAPGIEGVFGVIKAVLGIRRFNRCGLDKVRCDWTWICCAYNLKKLLALRAKCRKNGTGAPSEGPQAPVETASEPFTRPICAPQRQIGRLESLCSPANVVRLDSGASAPYARAA
jgi:transposase